MRSTAMILCVHSLSLGYLCWAAVVGAVTVNRNDSRVALNHINGMCSPMFGQIHLTKVPFNGTEPSDRR